MKKIYENDEEFNFIGEISRELTGYDPDNLLKEMEDAKRQWEEEQQEHPEEAKAVMQKAEADFIKLMERIRQTEAVVETSHEDKGEGCLEEIYGETENAAEILDEICVTADGRAVMPEEPRRTVAKVVKLPEEKCETVVKATETPEKCHKTIAGQAIDKASDEGYIRARPDGAGYTRSRADGEGYAGSTYDGMNAVVAARESAVNAEDREQAAGIITVSTQGHTVNAAAGEGYTGAKLSGAHSITDTTDKTYPEQHRTIARPEPEYKKPIPIRKKTLKRVVILTAAAMILGVGGMASVARQGYRVAEYPEQYVGDQRTVVRNNVAVSFPESKIEEAYKQIGDICGIKVVALDHLPENIKFDEFILKDNKGIIKLCNGGRRIYLEERVLEEKDAISVLTMDRKVGDVIKNEWLDKELLLEENKLQNGSIEYSVQFDIDSATYYLSGIMEKGEFIEIVENLYFWN